jgi:uncharacterized membrane protein YeaQ/YmgE (transglycosylase-associated protein family)
MEVVMDLVNLLITLVSGAAGGNIAGAAAPTKSLGVAGNSIIGLIGGGLGHYVLKHYLGVEVSPEAIEGAMKTVEGLDLTRVLENVGASGVGGAVLTFILGWIKNSLGEKA